MKMKFFLLIIFFIVIVTTLFAGCEHTSGVAQRPHADPSAVAPLPHADRFSESEVAYLQDLKSAIQEKLNVTKNWQALNVRVQFTLSREGQLSNIKIVSPPDITSKQRNEIKAAFASVSPFRPFPPDCRMLKRKQESFTIDIKVPK
jgi:hypothetical protein